MCKIMYICLHIQELRIVLFVHLHKCSTTTDYCIEFNYAHEEIQCICIHMHCMYTLWIPTAKALIEGMLCKDTTRRLTALRVLNDAWFTVSMYTLCVGDSFMESTTLWHEVMVQVMVHGLLLWCQCLCITRHVYMYVYLSVLGPVSQLLECHWPNEGHDRWRRYDSTSYTTTWHSQAGPSSWNHCLH